MSHESLTARRERRAALAPSPSPHEDDQTAWLLTFSDLVLQLFAFVLVATALGGAAHSAAPPPAKPVVETVPPPAPRVDVMFTPPRAQPIAMAAPAAPPAAIAPRDADADGVPDRLAEFGRRMEAFAGALDHPEGMSVRVRDSDLVLTLAETITFASGNADLLPSAGPILREIGRLAESMPEFDVEVTGYTDDVPIHTGVFPSNLELSLARAARVVREVAADRPALAERTIAAGLGEHRPLAPNDDEAGRARNRRVDVRLVPRERSLSTVSAAR